MSWLFDVALCVLLWRFAGMSGWLSLLLFFQLRILYWALGMRTAVDKIRDEMATLTEAFAVPPGLLGKVKNDVATAEFRRENEHGRRVIGDAD